MTVGRERVGVPMIKVLFFAEKNGECEKEFSQGDHWTDKGTFMEIRDKQGETIASFNSAKVICIEKQ